MTSMANAFAVFDLDGTLAECEHRRHFVSGPEKDWDSFFEACDQDTLNIPVALMLYSLRSCGTRVEIWSGRSDKVKEKTKRWLFKFGLGDIPIKMRRDKDRRPDEELKQLWLDEAKKKPTLVFDDRQKVVDMWRANGVPCFQVAPGDF